MKEERAIKLQRIRTFLEHKGMDAVYLKRQDNFAWLTGGGINYVGLGDFGNCGLLVTADRTFAVTNNIEAKRMAEEEHLEEMGFALRRGIWHDGTFEEKAVRELVGEGRLGLDFTSAMGENIAEEIKQLRFSLTREEMERYMTGGRLVAMTLEEVAAAARPGDSEYLVAGSLYGALRKQGLDIISAMCAADDRIANYRHPVPTERSIRERVQLGGNFRYRGLIICCTRLVNFVPVSAALRKQYRDNVEIDCVMMASSVPGNTFRDALEAGREAYGRLGYADEFNLHHQGGPIGYQAREYRVDFSHQGVIQENQAFCWNPSITGTKSEDTVINCREQPLNLTKPILFPSVTCRVSGLEFTKADILEKL